MTWDVSVNSIFWLNFFAPCRGSQAGYMRCGESCGPGGRGRRVTAWCARSGSAARTQWRGLDCRLGGGRGEALTTNMSLMSVTLFVSNLIGWLKTDAPCVPEGSQAGHGGEGRDSAQGGEHLEHVAHVRDFGRVCEFDLLVERVRFLPRGARRATHGAGRAARREAAGGR